jgi:hypothetical protein
VGSVRLVAVSMDFAMLSAAEVRTLWVRGDQGAREDVKEGTAAQRPSLFARLKAKSARVLGDYRLPHAAKFQTERSSPCSITGGTVP